MSKYITGDRIFGIIAIIVTAVLIFLFATAIINSEQHKQILRDRCLTYEKVEDMPTNCWELF